MAWTIILIFFMVCDFVADLINLCNFSCNLNSAMLLTLYHSWTCNPLLLDTMDSEMEQQL